MKKRGKLLEKKERKKEKKKENKYCDGVVIVTGMYVRYEVGKKKKKKKKENERERNLIS